MDSAFARSIRTSSAHPTTTSTEHSPARRGDYLYGTRFQGIWENENIEFKKCGTGNLGTVVNDCLRYAVGFLNARIKGHVYFGVCDDKTIEGVPLDPYVDASACLDTLHKKFESECLPRLNSVPFEGFFNFDIHYVRGAPSTNYRVIIIFSITKLLQSPLHIWAIKDREKETGEYALLKKKGILKMMSPTDVALLVHKYTSDAYGRSRSDINASSSSSSDLTVHNSNLSRSNPDATTTSAPPSLVAKDVAPESMLPRPPQLDSGLHTGSALSPPVQRHTTGSKSIQPSPSAPPFVPSSQPSFSSSATSLSASHFASVPDFKPSFDSHISSQITSLPDFVPSSVQPAGVKHYPHVDDPYSRFQAHPATVSPPSVSPPPPPVYQPSQNGYQPPQAGYSPPLQPSASTTIPPRYAAVQVTIAQNPLSASEPNYHARPSLYQSPSAPQLASIHQSASMTSMDPAPIAAEVPKEPHPKMTKENVIRILRQHPEGLEVREICLYILNRNPQRDRAESMDIQAVKHIV
jgi:hypothetical protein